MDNSSSKRGKIGEEQAASALKEAGMEIIAKNIRCQHGEIDIVALEGETIVFVEVKAWSSFGAEDLQYSLNDKKQKKIIKTAKYFLLENRKYNKMSIRFDVVLVQKDSLGDNCAITHLASAFTEGV